jgi:hypothetical protein
MSEALLEEVVKWLKQIPVPVSAEVEVPLREEDVDIQAMRGLCDAQLLQLGFDKMGHRSKIILAASAKSVVAPLAPVVPSPSMVRVATTVSKPRKVPTLKAAALLKAVQDLIANDPKVADTIEDAPLQGRAVFAPTFLSYNWKGMDERMVQYAGGISY